MTSQIRGTQPNVAQQRRIDRLDDCHCSGSRFTSDAGRACMRSEMETAMQNETSAVLASENQDRGFFGRIRHHAEPHPAWALAMEAIGNATACSDEAARD